jgi:rubrerythrin/rhodanese-related sulfurtransferase
MSDSEIIDGVEEWSPEKLRNYMRDHHPQDYQLIDVRPLQEYGAEHLPGAAWIPAEDLPLRLQELDSNKASIVYCAYGSLSRAAAQVMQRAGFREVVVLQGGLNSWQSGTAAGLPEQFSARLADAGNAQDQAILAWHVEEAARQFYDTMAKIAEEPEVSALFAELATAENHHKATLKALWEALSGRVAGDDFPGQLSSPWELMEGGSRLGEALAWAAQSSTAKIIDFAMALELNAYDHYLYLQRNASDPDSQRLFEVMAEEERHHLKSLGKSLENLKGRSR